jgi:NAD(P)H-hydrate epimerase
VKDLLPKRTPGAHKWGVGGVLVVAGSPLYPGAAWLASRAAGRAGAGIVLLATSRGVIGSIAGSLPEVAYVSLPESDSQSGAKRTLEVIQERLDRVRAVVIGPGLGDDEPADALLSTLFLPRKHGAAPTRSSFGFGEIRQPKAEVSASNDQDSMGPAIFGDGSLPVVIDADALNWLAKQPSWWSLLPEDQAVLTPHAAEFARLLDITPDEVVAAPAKLAQEAASRWKQTVVLKTGRTIASNGEVTVIAEEESPALATAGSGDVFAGTIGGLLAQGLAPLDAASLAIQLGTLAARALVAEFGEAGILSTDLPDAIARATTSL